MFTGIRRRRTFFRILPVKWLGYTAFIDRLKVFYMTWVSRIRALNASICAIPHPWNLDLSGREIIRAWAWGIFVLLYKKVLRCLYTVDSVVYSFMLIVFCLILPLRCFFRLLLLRVEVYLFQYNRFLLSRIGTHLVLFLNHDDIIILDSANVWGTFFAYRRWRLLKNISFFLICCK